MPNCGNCNKPVAASDVTCPHCGVLLAAYASPLGSGAAATYEPPPAPPSAEIPQVDMDVKPPSEAEIVTDPTEVAEEPVSTAPRPLFDTYLTVEEIAAAAESDHEDSVVTITNREIATKSVEFDVPDYARPPQNAAPIPTIEEDDASVPLITRDSAPDQPKSNPEATVLPPVSSESRKRDVPSDHKPAGDDDDDEPEPESDPAGESWLHTIEQTQATQTSPPDSEQDILDRLISRPSVEPKPQAEQPTSAQEPPGQTDEYLRRLHQEAGYRPTDTAVSRPVEQRRLTPAERNRNRRAAIANANQQAQSASEASMQMGCSTLYAITLVILWLSLVLAMLNGHFNPFLIFLVAALTWGRKPISKVIQQVSQQ